MSRPSHTNSNAARWDDLVEEFDFSPAERTEIERGAEQMIATVRAHRLAEVRKRQHATQVDVASAMGVTQARVSRIERGELERSEVETLAAYVRALGGKLKIVAEFGDEQYVLG
ncbi:XRE family transcriptional regulator [Streptomyces olivaceiscleroticus]|uniref:XRE family transcriptional regulator n=1 Tax=Streptomyces olivaceiscleroticus TaxID=68245 RepID=A0ABP3JIF9_9ACTN